MRRLSGQGCGLSIAFLLDWTSFIKRVELGEAVAKCRNRDGDELARRSGLQSRSDVREAPDMSAIVGVFYKSVKPAEAERLARMIAVLSHRGSDSGSRLVDGQIALASLNAPPLTDGGRSSLSMLERPRLRVVADARIDNGDELRAALRLPPAVRPSDAELILLCYRQWGTQSAARLRGDFAFAIWDAAERRLYCGRDPMGVKPFYYYDSEDLFAFATEPKSLFVLGLPRTIDQEQMVLYLAREQRSRSETIYRNVKRLPAAHTLTITPSSTLQEEYWRLEPKREIRFAKPEQYVEAFREMFLDAVRVRVRGPAPVAAALSGGLDSSSIVCAARLLGHQRSAGHDLHTFSLIFPDLPAKEQALIDERRYVDAVVGEGGLHAHFVRGDQVSPLGEIDRILWHLDEPYDAPNLFLHWSMYRAASENGCGVFLDGLDGDTTVSHGLGRLNSLAASRKWDQFEAEVRHYSVLRAISAERVLEHYGFPHLSYLAARGHWFTWFDAASQLSRRFQLSRSSVLKRFALDPLLQGRLKRKKFAHAGLLRPHFARELRLARIERPGLEKESHVAALSQPLYQVAMEMADKAAAAFGVEPRYPFFDQRLIEFCLALPEEQKFEGGWTRLILRRALDGILPQEVQWRPGKANLAPNFQRRFHTCDRAAVEMADRELGEYLDIDAYRRLASNYFNDPDRAWGDQDAEFLLRATTAARWLSQIREQPVEIPMASQHHLVA
jgi:asparagine synthase (glutamine-hydrolysing)